MMFAELGKSEGGGDGYSGHLDNYAFWSMNKIHRLNCKKSFLTVEPSIAYLGLKVPKCPKTPFIGIDYSLS